MGKYLRISSYIRKPFLIYDFATAPLRISLYMRKIRFCIKVPYGKSEHEHRGIKKLGIFKIVADRFKLILIFSQLMLN
jgi:hypothetical protein